MKLTISNFQQCLWHGSITIKNPLSVQNDYHNSFKNDVDDTYDKECYLIDEYEDLSYTKAKAKLYEKTLEKILDLVKSSMYPISKFKLIESTIKDVLELIPENYVYIKHYDLEDNEFLFQDLVDEYLLDLGLAYCDMDNSKDCIELGTFNAEVFIKEMCKNTYDDGDYSVFKFQDDWIALPYYIESTEKNVVKYLKK